jgi:hypothetical protein
MVERAGGQLTTERLRGSRRAVAALATCLLLIGICAPPSFGASASCGRTSVVRDFLAPLSKMAPIRRVPSSGKLPFGPAGLKLSSGSQLVVGTGSAGFSFSDEAIEQQRNLQWRVEASLFRVDRSGRIRSTVAMQTRRLGVVEGNGIKGFLFDIPGSPAFYRVDLSIRTLEGNRILGTFSEYVRVMRKRSNLRVVVDEPTVVARGQTAHARLINLGTVPLESASYVFGFKIRRFDGSSWVFVAENPPRGPVPKRMQILPPGRENLGCLRYRVPDDAPAGKYRFQAGKLVAEFEVTSSPLR